VAGILDVSLSYFPTNLESGTPALEAGNPADVIVNVQDTYGNPISGLHVEVILEEQVFTAEQTDVAGEYVAHIPMVTVSQWGDINITVLVEGDLFDSVTEEETVFISAAVPDLNLGVSSFSFLGGGSFLISLIGLLIYFRLASSMRVKDKSMSAVEKSVRQIDRVYGIIVFGGALSLAGSFAAANIGEYVIALGLTIVLLGVSILLYGIWLYRDAISSVYVKGALDKKRMVLGLWHLFFVPLVIYMIFTYGAQVQWFDQYVLYDAIEFQGLRIPTIMTTIFTAYVSSILIVVFNLYREASKGVKRIDHMIASGTPMNIVEEEKELMAGKFASSIRVKFLMFLVVIAATTVMSMDWLRSYSLGIIVLMPIVFIVVIPFLTSKVIQFFSKASGVVTRKKGETEI
jgi:hypothetical protein